MTITTVEQMLTSKLGQPIFFVKDVGSSANFPRTVWYQNGYPSAGVFNSTTPNGAILGSSSTGSLPISNPLSGETRIASMSFSSGIGGFFVLYDRLWQCGADNLGQVITPVSTSVYSIVSPTWPARDNSSSTNGEGVFLAVETQGGITGTTDATITYTNSNGVSGRTATLVNTFTASAVSGAWHTVGLQSGDTGVRSVQSIQFSTAVTTVNTFLVAFRVLGAFSVNSQNYNTYVDPITAPLPPILNNSCLSFWYYPVTSTPNAMNATLILAQG